jgi:glycosyltransferase involved in cell wall biosynthesis
MPFLPLTLASIANQTYTNHRILAWDDCSNDGTLEELHRWIPDRIPGRIFEGKSLRIGPCLAFLVEQADTELCARIDGDDIAHPHRLERQVAYMTEHPEVSMVGSQTQFIDSDGKELPSWKLPACDADARWLTRFTAPVAHSAVVYRRSTILAAGNYPSEFQFEDAALWTRMSVMKFEFHNIPEALTKYRRTTTSGTGLIKDWLAPFREIARAYGSTVFPGIPDPVQAMELWEATHPHQRSVAPKLWHLKALDRAAVAHARLVGKPDDYFLNCEAFKEQRYLLRRDILQRFGLGPLVHLRERLARKQSVAAS